MQSEDNNEIHTKAETVILVAVLAITAIVFLIVM
jgi:hypothetical protein